MVKRNKKLNDFCLQFVPVVRIETTVPFDFLNILTGNRIVSMGFSFLIQLFCLVL